MKCILLIISVLVALSQGAKPSQEIIDLSIKLQNTYIKCTEKNNVTSVQSDNLGTFQLPLDKNMQCAFACIGKDFEIMKSDNTIDKTKVANMMKTLMDDFKQNNQEEIGKKITEVVDICLPLQKGNSDECVAANKVVECFFENGKKNGLIPSAH